VQLSGDAGEVGSLLQGPRLQRVLIEGGHRGSEKEAEYYNQSPRQLFSEGTGRKRGATNADTDDAAVMQQRGDPPLSNNPRVGPYLFSNVMFLLLLLLLLLLLFLFLRLLRLSLLLLFLLLLLLLFLLLLLLLLLLLFLLLLLLLLLLLPCF
jgi:hypothetical protein